MYFKKNKYMIICIWLCIFYILVVLDLVAAYKHTYAFKRNSNSEILFFEEKEEKTKANAEICEDIKFKILFDVDLIHFKPKNLVFIYKKENFIEFKLLNAFLLPNISESSCMNGMIKCNFELPYILKLTKDITEITNKPSTFTLKCMLTCLSRMKTSQNKYVNKLLQQFIYTDFFHKNMCKSKKRGLNFNKMFKSEFFTGIDISTRISIISGYLNIFMIKFTFYDENLILLGNTNEHYDITLFNENIPYKNLLINNHKVFYFLKNILQETYIWNIFMILLNILNIKSLILNNDIGFVFLNMDFQFFIPLIQKFEAIKISNFTKYSSFLFLEKLSKVLKGDIGFLSFINIWITENTLVELLKKQNLKGLVLREVYTIGNIDPPNNYAVSYKKLEYIDYCCAKINIIRWNNLFQMGKISKIILSFHTSKSQEDFIQEFTKLRFQLNILYFKVKFFSFKLSVEFCMVLLNLANLQTLNLYGYISYKSTEPFLFKAIGNMKHLEYLQFQQPFFYMESHQFLESQELKFLILKNIFLHNETSLACFFKSYKSLIKLALICVKISMVDLEEIFKLEKLLELSIESCKIEDTSHLKPLYSVPIKIISFYFSDTKLEILNHWNILEKLDYLEKLYVSDCNLVSGSVAKLSLMCNRILKTLSYKFGTLDITDINRIEKFEILEELNLYRCRFLNCSFHGLGNNCRFFNSLENLNLLNVNINLKDLECFLNFKKLKKLSLSPSGLDLLKIKHFIVSLPIYQVVTNNIRNEPNYEKMLKYLYEENIDLVQDY